MVANALIHWVTLQRPGSSTFATVARTTTSYNSGGLVARGTGAVSMMINGNVVTRNTVGSGTGVHQEGTAVVESTGNNTVRYNTLDTFGTITPVPAL